MRKTCFLIVTTILLSMQGFGVVPEAIKYQAVARDNNGNVLVNKTISIRLTILKTSVSGTAVYTETHVVTTNNLGMINLEIGHGVPVFGTLMDIQWDADNFFIKIEMDDTGGSSYTLVGTTQLVSVPYSLFAKRAGNGTQWSDTTTNIYYNTGRVGVGTNNPKAPLEVHDNDRTGNSVMISGEIPTIRMSDTAYSGNGVTMGVAADSNDLIPGSGKGDFVITNEAFGTGGGYIFGTGVPSSTCVKITDDCNVGIGTDEPVTKLDIRGGDIQLADIGAGVIMKSPDGQCWKLTVSNTGQPVFTSMTCLTVVKTQDSVNCFGAKACYTFNGNANDTSGNHFNGSVYLATLTSDRHGNANSAYHFSGYHDTPTYLGDYIQLPNLSTMVPGQEISISLWVRQENVGQSPFPFCLSPDNPSDRFSGTINWTSQNNGPIFDYGDIAFGRATASSLQALSYDIWDHYVYVRSKVGNFMKVYKNGVLIVTKNSTVDMINKNLPLRIGGGGYDPSAPVAHPYAGYLVGSVDDVKIFDRALLDTEVLNIYNKEK